MSKSSHESAENVKSVVQQISKIVSEMAGIQLGDKQASMVENRLRTRISKVGVKSFQEYLSYLKSHQESESQALLSLMTTHHTYFFREFSHFEFLLNRGLPRAIEKARARTDKTIRVWSAACSRGQEVYSLAMFFSFHLSKMAPDVKYEIWGTDIDPESVETAQNGVYKTDELRQSPAMYVDGNWIRGTGNVKDFMKVKDSLKKNCKFTTANLLSPEGFLSDKKFDVIFCRNVFIYFNHEQIKQITKSFLKHLDESGLLVLGVSETLNGLGLDLDLIGPSAYQHKDKVGTKGPHPSPLPKVEKQKIYEVLSVDDSGTILALLKKILGHDSGFQVTATAKNGREALNILKTKKFDVITLDLHMPELDGVGFLQEYKNPEIPVLIVSSINRDDTTIAQKAIQLGASDYVEKPSLENVAQAGDEIRGKLKTIIKNKTAKSVGVAPAAVGAKNLPPKPTAPASGTLSPTAKPSGKIKVLIVDDSSTIRNLLNKIISSDSSFEVIGMASKPSEVEPLIKKNRPDVITLDIHMPEMDGVTLLQKIHPIYRIPTVMISSISKEEGPQVLKALEVGAVDYIQKPQMNEMAEASQLIRDRLKVAAQAKVLKQTVSRKITRNNRGLNSSALVLIGASTGGTEALRVVLESMPENIPPILIVQHIPPVFSTAFANRLNTLCSFPVKEATDGDEVKPNQVLIAPGGCQMAVVAKGDKLFVRVNNDAPMNRHKPSVDYLFKSAIDAKLGNITAAILTGMGADGARQMKALRDQGARTIAQNQETCVVYGMPREAAAMGGAEFVLPLESIAEKILTLSEANTATSRTANKKAS